MSWTLLAFGSVFFFTFLNILQKTLAINSKSPRAMALIFNVIAAFISVLIFAATGSFKNFSLPTDPKAWVILVIATFCYAIFERYKFFAIKLLDASVFTTIINISVLVAFVGSLFLYSETLTTQKLLGGLLIIGALLTVSLNNKAKRSSIKGILITIPISIILGLGWMLDKMGAQLFNANTYNILVWAIPVIFIYLPYMKLDEIKTELKITSWKIFLLAGLNVVGYLMQLKALEVAEATRVIPIVQTSTLFTVLMGIILLKERDFIARKIIAGVMAIIGVYFLI